MPTGVYSERFLLISVPETWWTFTVPPGRRAVIRSILVATNLASQCNFQLAVGPTVIYTAVVPGAEGARNIDCRAVVYAGESMSGYVWTQGSSMTVSGYLLEAPIGTTAPPSEEAGAPPAGWIEIDQLPSMPSDS